MTFACVTSCGVLFLLAALPGGLAAEDPKPVSVPDGRPPLLNAAFQSFLEQQGRWAYIETHSSTGDIDDSNRGSILRVDPSKPYAEQFVPIKLAGREPSSKERKAWAKRGETKARERERRAVHGKSAEEGDEDFRLRINGREVAPDLAHAIVVEEDDSGATYEVPLRKSNDAPFEEVRVTARVNKQRREFEHVTIRQVSTRRAGAGKFSDGLTEIEFDSPDPQFPSVPVKITWQATNKPMFGKPNTRRNVAVRTELTRVTPYDERFSVDLGPLRVIEF